MSSTAYEHFVDTNKMCAAQEQFRNITKLVCARFRGLTKHTICRRCQNGDVLSPVCRAWQYGAQRRRVAAAFLARCYLWRRLA